MKNVNNAFFTQILNEIKMWSLNYKDETKSGIKMKKKMKMPKLFRDVCTEAQCLSRCLRLSVMNFEATHLNSEGNFV